MKKLLSAAFIVVSAIAAFATAQFTERINDGGIEKGMANCLLELDSVSFSRLKDRLPGEIASTALWRRYIGHWKIKNDSLFLDSVLVKDNSCVSRQFVPAEIDDIYASRRTTSGFFADWVTDTVRIVSGPIVCYQHMGWESDWETEELLTVEGGRVKDRNIYKNRVVNPVSNGSMKAIIDSLNLGVIPGKILLRLGYQGFDKDGTPTGYKADIQHSCGDTTVDDRIVRAFQNAEIISKLVPIYYVRGQYKFDNYNIVIPRSQKDK